MNDSHEQISRINKRLTPKGLLGVLVRLDCLVRHLVGAYLCLHGATE